MTHPTPSPTARTLSNQATAYGVRINPAAIADAPHVWRVVSARHLSPDENRGNHHIYIDALDESGQPDRNPALRIGWTWQGRRDDEAADPKPLDKSDGGAMGNVDLYQGQVTTVWIEGDDLPSERAENLHTDHDVLEKTSEGEDGNTRFHHSFHVVFQRVRNSEPAPVTVTLPSTPAITPMVNSTNGQTPAPASLGRGVVSGVELNLRRAPDKNSERISSLFRHDAVDIFEQLGEWLRVRSLAATTVGQEGYVFGEYVQWAGSVHNASTTHAPNQPNNALSNYRDLINEQAQRLGLDPAVALAIVVTESPGGAPFAADGRMIIRFENHIFWERWGARHPGQFVQHFQMNEGKRWDGDGHFWRPSPDAGWQAFHGRQEREWQVFEFARGLDETAAMLSISMGAPQIMGFNHTRLQYATVQEMFQAFASDAHNQIEGLFDFIQASGALTPLLQGDYEGFARIYNGPGQAADYAAIIQRNLAQFQQPRGAATSRGLQPVETEAKPRMAAPPSPIPGKPLIEADPKLYEAWSNHIKQGFENSQTMFNRVLQAFMDPYWMTVRMYRLLFAVGIGAFVFSGVLALIGALYPDANTTAALGGSILFGGLGVVAFLTYFVNRSLQALEENLQFITWLGVIYNSYWTRLAYQQNLDTVQADVEDITNDAISQINALLDKHTLLSGKRPNLPSEEKK